MKITSKRKERKKGKSVDNKLLVFILLLLLFFESRSLRTWKTYVEAQLLLGDAKYFSN